MNNQIKKLKDEITTLHLQLAELKNQDAQNNLLYRETGRGTSPVARAQIRAGITKLNLDIKLKETELAEIKSSRGQFVTHEQLMLDAILSLLERDGLVEKYTEEAKEEIRALKRELGLQSGDSVLMSSYHP